MIWAMPATQPEPNAPHGPLPTGGTVRPITRWGTPPMHTPQSRVTEFDDELRSLVADMVTTMYAADGVGSAASQTGEDSDVVVLACPEAEAVQTDGVICTAEVDFHEDSEPRESATDGREADDVV